MRVALVLRRKHFSQLTYTETGEKFPGFHIILDTFNTAYIIVLKSLCFVGRVIVQLILLVVYSGKIGKRDTPISAL